MKKTVKAAQKVLKTWMSPNGSLSDAEALNQLMGILANKKLVREQQRKEYLSQVGCVCPQCHSGNIKTKAELIHSGTNMTQYIECLDCGASWDDVYSLHDYANLKTKPKKDKTSK